MLVFLLISVFVSLACLMTAPVSSALPVRELHQMCVLACPRVTHSDFLRAVVCGEPLSASLSAASLRSDFVRTGLIHLLVVSGSHLICLEQWVRFFSSRFRAHRFFVDAFIFSVLAVFTAVTLASPPVMRAFVSWCLSWLARRLGLGWSRAQVVTMSGFATLAVCRTRWDFASLALSWVAALGFAVAGSGVSRLARVSKTSGWRERLGRMRATAISALRTHAVVYVTLVPALLPLGIPSVLSVFCNVAFAPIMGLILFPASVAGFLGLARFAEWAWDVSLWIVSRVSSFMPDPWNAVSLSPLALVPYIVCLSAFLVWRERRACALAFCLTFFVLPARADELIVWNIGQGSWATLKSDGLCEHFDMGGEWAPTRAIHEACSGSANEVYFSHWDWDHIGLSKTGLKLLPNLCVQAAPGGPAPNNHKLRLIDDLPRCSSRARAREIFLSHETPSALAHLHGANDFSQVFVEDGIVFPGDSPSQAEKIWRKYAAASQILIAGHHGSKSATSDALLDSLVHVREIVASAHKSRYGHPHPKMLARARAHHLPVVTTEDWGSLHFEIKVRLAPKRREAR